MKRGIFHKRSKKAQAAMEFLMTYGWALLVVLVAIGALAFFGVLNPGQFLPDQCVLFAGVTCTTFFASQQVNPGVTITIQNGLGYSMQDIQLDILNVDGSSTPWPGATCIATATITIPDGGTQTCLWSIGAKEQGDKIKGQLQLSWKDDSGFQRTRLGNLALTVEA